jgi:predicted DNA-binding transcriptional regulator AlpA
MTNDVPVPHGKVLHSWKEIASYTGRGVRTIQRYESKLGFPIRRPAGVWRSAVLAFSNEIDEWLAKSPMKEDSIVPDSLSQKKSRAQITAMQHEMVKKLHREVQVQHERAMAMTQRMIETQQLVTRMHTFMRETALARKAMRPCAQANLDSMDFLQDKALPGGGRQVLARA